MGFSKVVRWAERKAASSADGWVERKAVLLVYWWAVPWADSSAGESAVLSAGDWAVLSAELSVVSKAAMKVGLKAGAMVY